MILSFFAWAWRGGHVSAETLLSIRSVPALWGSDKLAQPMSSDAFEKVLGNYVGEGGRSGGCATHAPSSGYGPAYRSGTCGRCSGTAR
jgi:hypothetical protein